MSASPRQTRQLLQQQAKGTHLLRRREADGAIDAPADRAVGPAGPSRVAADQSRQRIEALVRKIIEVAPDGSSAIVALPAGVAIPGPLLRRILADLGVCHGLDQSEIEAAAHRAEADRRLRVARIDLVGSQGVQRDIYGHRVVASGRRLKIEVSSDEMEAVLLLTCHPLALEVIKRALQSARVVHGLDKQVIADLLARSGPISGRFVIARGTLPVWPRAAGFRLGGKDGVEVLQRVKKGTLLARWMPGRPGAVGLTVTGRQIPVPVCDERHAEVSAGLGTTMEGFPPNDLQLRATRDGVCYQRIDGTVVVTEIHRIADGLPPAAAPVATNEVLVIEGGVADGNKVTCTTDIIVCGDVGDAVITTGGSLSVEGRIKAGSARISAAEGVQAKAVEGRIIEADSVQVDGVVRHSTVTVTGDLTIRQVIGGTLTAGGSIFVTEVGDRWGTKTKLWAGHTLNGGDMAGIKRLQISGKIRQRHDAVTDLQLTHQRLAAVLKSLSRLQQAAYVNPEQARWIHGQAGHLSEKAKTLETTCESLRQEIAGERQAQRQAIDAVAEDRTPAIIEVEREAHHNVGLKIDTLTTRYYEKTGHHVNLDLRRELMRRSTEDRDAAAE